ncbi:B12-binding domain-containing radical SAM protein [Verrucomicrobiota bacterium]
MNIVLIHPYITVNDPGIYLSEPLGLLYLATYLKHVFGEEVQVTVLDLYAMGADKPKRRDDLYVLGIDDEAYIKNELHRLAPDLVGITCNFTAYAIDAFEIAAIVKRAMSSVPVVMGGAHATIEAESILKENHCVDFVVRGEGEITLEQLVRSFRGEYPVETVESVSFRPSEQTIKSNPPRELIKNMDMLPIPDRTFIDMDRYKSFNKKCLWYARNEPIATIMTSRGCPYNCVFCSTNVMWERKWRPFDLEKVIEEIELLVSKYGIREIVINDDQFMTKKDRIHDFCDYFIERGLDLCFWYEAGTSTWLVDEKLLVKMRRAGFYAIRFPIESGCSATLKFIRKPVDLQKTRELIVKANKLGYWTSANFIIGFPYETREQIVETVGYAYDTALDYSYFFIAKPNAGSDLYDILKKDGLIKQDAGRGSHYYYSDYDTSTMTAVELNKLLSEASGRWFVHKFFFFLNPKNFYTHLLPKLKSREDFRYLFKIFWVLFRKKINPILKNAFKTT